MYGTSAESAFSARELCRAVVSRIERCYLSVARGGKEW